MLNVYFYFYCRVINAIILVFQKALSEDWLDLKKTIRNCFSPWFRHLTSSNTKRLKGIQLARGKTRENEIVQHFSSKETLNDMESCR